MGALIILIFKPYFMKAKNQEVTYSDVKEALELEDGHRYYVYRLVDPRNLQTFYVGKGSGDRVFQHIHNVLKNDIEEDELSLKSKLIAEIMAAGKQVIAIIHRRGLTKYEAFEVEAALIDAYPGLTNIQNGHNYERGAISLEDLSALLNIEEYNEPEEDYILIKTSYNAISLNGNLYEATRRSWRAKLENAQKFKYVFSVIDGIVREVYKVQRWYQYDDTQRIAFDGSPVEKDDPMAQYKNKRIPEYYRTKGSANPFQYKKGSKNQES